jgi:hypothetical protein
VSAWLAGEWLALAIGLGGVELTRVRYAILVSEESIPDDVTEGAVSCRHLNIAVAPGTPSKRKQT